MEYQNTETVNVHYKPYSDSVLGYCVNLNRCQYEFVINSNIPKDKQKYAYMRLLNELPQFEKYGFILLHSNDTIYYHDAYNYSKSHRRYIVEHDKAKIINFEHHKEIVKIEKIRRKKESGALKCR